ncbi:hypothetical protein AAHZ94_34365, partial [Streptomyces sp. HSW2009]
MRYADTPRATPLLRDQQPPSSAASPGDDRDGRPQAQQPHQPQDAQPGQQPGQPSGQASGQAPAAPGAGHRPADPRGSEPDGGRREDEQPAATAGQDGPQAGPNGPADDPRGNQDGTPAGGQNSSRD